MNHAFQMIPVRPRPPHPVLQLFIVGGLGLLGYGGYANPPLVHPWLDYLQSLFTQRVLWWLFCWSVAVHAAEAAWVAHHLITRQQRQQPDKTKLAPSDVLVWALGTFVFGMGVASQLVWPQPTEPRVSKDKRQ